MDNFNKTVQMYADWFNHGAFLGAVESYLLKKDSPNLSEAEKKLCKIIEAALERTDLEALYNNPAYEIEEKFPTFYKYLEDFMKDLEEEKTRNETTNANDKDKPDDKPENQPELNKDDKKDVIDNAIGGIGGLNDTHSGKNSFNNRVSADSYYQNGQLPYGIEFQEESDDDGGESGGPMPPPPGKNNGHSRHWTTGNQGRQTRKHTSCNIEAIARKYGLKRQLNKQGFVMHQSILDSSMAHIRSFQLSNNDMDYLAENYTDILKANCRSGTELAWMNGVLEKRYLNDKQITELRNAENKIHEAGIRTLNTKKLEKMLKDGTTSDAEKKVIKEYLKKYKESRETIIRDGIFSTKRTHITGDIENAFAAVSLTSLLKENGMETDPRKLKRQLKAGKLNADQERIAKSVLAMRRSMMMRDSAMRLAKGTLKTGKKAYYNIKSTANKYMAQDYTMRGLMTALNAAGYVKKAAGTSLKIGWKALKLGRKTWHAAKAVPGGIVKTISAVQGGALKNAPVKAGKKAAKAAKDTLIKAKKAIKSPGKTSVKIAKKTAKALAHVIIRLLSIITSTLMALGLPVLLVLIFVLMMIATICSFVFDSADNVYYDAGNNDTEAVVQEMVDLLTICHNSFRESLENGGSPSTTAATTDEDASGTATDYGITGPQLQKGESSKVAEKYNVTQGSWWNYEFGDYGYGTCTYAAGTAQRQLQDKIINEIGYTGQGVYSVIYDKIYLAATTLYWGNPGDILKVTFNTEFKMNSEAESTDTIYVCIVDTKSYRHTLYPSEPEGLYGHHNGNGTRDFLEFTLYGGASADSGNLNGKGILPVEATNMGSILDGTCDIDGLGVGGSSVIGNSDYVFYVQDIDQSTYRNIINEEKNIYYTLPDEVDPPDGITPTPKPKKDEEETEGTIYGFYNNNQELISMIWAMFDFEINNTTSLARDVYIDKEVESASDSEVADAISTELSSKMDDDTWKLVSFLENYGMNLSGYQEGGYDDIKYTTLVGLFNASHVVTKTPVFTYHTGPDGQSGVSSDHKTYDASQNTDGKSYEEPVYKDEPIYAEDGLIIGSQQVIATDENGETIYETKYAPCPGHRTNSFAVITVHFDGLLDIQNWWEENIYNVDNFDEENPKYSSDNDEDDNYKAKEHVLKNGLQLINKPDYFKSESDTCDSAQSNTSFDVGVMTESQKEVANTTFKFLTDKMGIEEEPAYGILANILRECSFDYTDEERDGDSSSGYGLIQWTGSRRNNLKAWCESHPESGNYNTLEGQLAFLKAEMEGTSGYGNMWTSGYSLAGLKACTNAYDADIYFMKGYERCSASAMADRTADAASDTSKVRAMID